AQAEGVGDDLDHDRVGVGGEAEARRQAIHVADVAGVREAVAEGVEAGEGLRVRGAGEAERKRERASETVETGHGKLLSGSEVMPWSRCPGFPRRNAGNRVAAPSP